jgi:uncharacterized protein (TIGR02996 family)
MRTFQFSDAKSHKFWQIDVQGKSFIVTYGKVGTAGQSQTKTFPTPQKAQEEADKLIKEKTSKGYAETTPKAAASDAEAFERALAANPDDVAARSAYADYLTERGDPRGEFMQVQLALEDESLPKAERDRLKKQEKALLKAHEADWLGSLAPFLLDQNPPKQEWRRNERITYRFRRGWLDDLEIPRLGVELTRALNRCREARFLRRLHVHSNAYEFPAGSGDIPEYADGTFAPGPDLPAGVDHYVVAYHLLAKFPHFAAVRVLHLGNSITETYDDSDQCHTEGDVAYHYVKQMPNAEEVYLLAHNVDTNKLFALPMPRLRVLQVFHARNYPVEKLAANKTLTNLTHLLLQPHAPDEDEPYLRLRHLRAVCRSPHLPKLTHLAFRFTDAGDPGVEEIVSSGLLKRLTVLDLTGGCVTDEGARRLAASADVKSLNRLALDTNALTKTGIDALKKAKINVSAREQHNEVPPFEEGMMPEFFFYADIE